MRMDGFPSSLLALNVGTTCLWSPWQPVGLPRQTLGRPKRQWGYTSNRVSQLLDSRKYWPCRVPRCCSEMFSVKQEVRVGCLVPRFSGGTCLWLWYCVKYGHCGLKQFLYTQNLSPCFHPLSPLSHPLSPTPSLPFSCIYSTSPDTDGRQYSMDACSLVVPVHSTSLELDPVRIRGKYNTA